MSSFSVSSAFWQQAWPLVGWTMLWFLAAGTIVLFVGAILRVLFKRANSQVRYCTSLAGFAVLALLPMLIAGYLTTSLPHEMARSSRPGLDETTNFIELNPKFETKNQNDSLASLPRERGERVGDNRSAEETTNLTNDTNQNLVIPGWDNRAMLNAILNAIVSYLPWLWLVGTPLTFLLLATGLIGAERLRKSCQTVSDGPIHAACERVRAQLAIARHVGIAICHSVSSPLLIGVVKPLILLPPAALTGWTTEELEMVLLHELAHVRRWDNAVNLVQRIVESLLFFHPATWIMSNWVRRDREDCCDAIVVARTAKPQAYAELLLTLTSHTPGLATSVAMAQHPIASRIRRILKIEDEPMLISRKGLTLGIGIVLATVLLAFALPASEAEEASLPRERGESEKVSREAERVADERSAEETTNPTNDTNKDLTTEDTESTEEEPNTREIWAEVPGDEKQLASILESIRKQGYESRTEKIVTEDKRYVNVVWITVPKTASHRVVFEEHPEGLRARVLLFDKSSKLISAPTDKPALNNEPYSLAESTTTLNAEAAETAKIADNPLFPTLEEQRAADFVYKLLGVELEKATPGELEMIGFKGYKSGLRVASSKEDHVVGGLSNDDVLVGLHVWPTESLDQVQEILSRHDIHELSPLKFYVIRREPGENKVVTGRINVDLDAWAEKEGFKQETLKQSQSQMDPGPGLSQSRYYLEAVKQSPLLYDGKTFDQWRNLWTTELKTEKRVECIKALAAFGRTGRGQEASEAILDVAAEFDFGNFEGSSAQDLKQAITQVLAGVEGIEGQYWLPQLMERLKADPAKWNSFAEWVLEDARGKNVAPYLKQLARDPSLSVYARAGAIAGLASQQDIADDAESMTMVREVLTGDDPKMIPALISNLNFTRLDLFPEQAEFLIHKNDVIRNAAWGQFRRGFNPAQGVPFMELFLKVIDDPTRKEDHAHAIEALGLLSSHFNNNADMQKRQPEVVDKLTQLLIDGNVELLPATLLTRSKLGAQSVELLIENLGDEITAERRRQLDEAAQKAEDLEAQQNMGMRGGGIGGGGRGGGGGMF